MRVVIFICFLLISSAIFGQEIGSVINGKYSLKLLKNKHRFELVYSDIGGSAEYSENSFNFSNKNIIYKILMDGFNDKDHQIIVQANKDTIVKFEYKRVRGEWMLKIKQNNLSTKTTGISTFYNKEQIIALFGNP